MKSRPRWFFCHGNLKLCGCIGPSLDWIFDAFLRFTPSFRCWILQKCNKHHQTIQFRSPTSCTVRTTSKLKLEPNNTNKKSPNPWGSCFLDNDRRYSWHDSLIPHTLQLCVARKTVLLQVSCRFPGDTLEPVLCLGANEASLANSMIGSPIQWVRVHPCRKRSPLNTNSYTAVVSCCCFFFFSDDSWKLEIEHLQYFFWSHVYS